MRKGTGPAPWITQVGRASIMDPFANHTFQPGDRITRADLAAAVSAIVRQLAASRRPDLRTVLQARRPRLPTCRADTSVIRRSRSPLARASCRCVDGKRFEVARPVSGAEAADTIARLRTLAGPLR